VSVATIRTEKTKRDPSDGKSLEKTKQKWVKQAHNVGFGIGRGNVAIVNNRWSSVKFGHLWEKAKGKEGGDAEGEKDLG
jgi:hypothetical protein